MQESASSISLLRSLVDFEAYTPDAASPKWLLAASRVAHSDPGVLALLGPSGLSIASEGGKRTRVIPDTPGLLLSGLVDRLRSTQRHVAIGVPPAARHLPLLLAGSSVLASVVDKTSVGPGRGDGSVLVVSPDLEARSRYCDLYVATEPLDEAYPGSRMRPDGQRVPLQPISTAKGIHGVCFFLPLLSLPSGIAVRPSMIVLDVRYARWVKRISDLASWATKVGGHAGVVALYSLGDTDTQQALISSGFADFPLDQSAIVACGQHAAGSPLCQTATVDWDLTVAPSYLVREHVIALLPQSAEVERALAAANRLLYGHAQTDGPVVRRARWILATLIHLPVPVVVYEYSARALGRRTLRSFIDGLGASKSSGYGAPATERAIKDALDHLYKVLWDRNPCEEKLRELLPAVAEREGERQVLLLVRDVVVERAVQSWIADEAFPRAPWILNLDVQACPNFMHVSAHRYRQALVIGAFPRRYSWIAGTALAPQVTFVVYQPEIDAIRRQLESIYGHEGRGARAKQRDALMQELSSDTRSTGGPESAVAPLHLAVPPLDTTTEDRPSTPKQAPFPKPQVTIRDLSRLGAAFRQVEQVNQGESGAAAQSTWAEDLGDDEFPEEGMGQQSDAASAYGEPMACRRLHVNSRAYGRGIMWLPPDRPIEVFRHADADDLVMLTLDRLKPGDVVLVMRDLERTSLFDRIVQLAESQPEMRYLAARRRAWQDAVRHMASRYTVAERVDYARLLRDLQSAGTPIQSELAVRFWVQGDVIGPESLRSIIAVGKVSGSQDLVRRAREFDQAFRDIRGIRQGIGMRLSTAIRQAFRHVTEGEAPSKARLNDHLGIAVDELIDSIDLAEVIAVDAMSQHIPLHQVGRFQRH